MAPVVIYIDNVEHLFVNSKKSDSAGRFKKDLITYKKWLDERKDRVVIIGNLTDPSKLTDSSRKEIKTFFDRALYIPRPDYESRYVIWKRIIEERAPSSIENLDLSVLSRISEGYSSGSIVYTIRKTLSKRRIMQLRKKPLKEDEFIAVLSRCEKGTNETNQAFQSFTDHVTDLAKRRKMAISDGSDGGEKGSSSDGDKKSGGGKKKKKKKKK
jgi:IQ and AAA domain-containing protein